MLYYLVIIFWISQYVLAKEKDDVEDFRWSDNRVKSIIIYNNYIRRKENQIIKGRW